VRADGVAVRPWALSPGWCAAAGRTT